MPQGTVKAFDADAREAVLLDDRLRELPVDSEAFAASGLYELRVGQRVRFELEDGPGDAQRVAQLNIVSL